MKKAAAGLLALAGALAVAGAAQAQVCAGFPTADRGFYFGGRADFPEARNSFGVEGNYNAAGPIGVYGGLDVVSIEGVDDSDFNVMEVGAAWEIASLGLMIGPRVSACPAVSARWSDIDGDAMQIPVGLGIGASLGVPGLPVHGYVQPQLVITTGENALGEDDTRTDFGVKAGVMFGFGMIAVGGEVRHIVYDNAPDPTLGIRIGVRL